MLMAVSVLKKCDSVSPSILFTGPDPVQLLVPKVKIIMKVNNLNQDIRGTRLSQLKTLMKEDVQNFFRGCKNDGINVFARKRIILGGFAAMYPLVQNLLKI